MSRRGLARSAMRRLVGLTGGCVLLAACNPPGGSTLGAQTTSGAVRLSDSAFGLLIYPCWDGALVSEIVLSEVVLAEVGVVESSQVILRERYPQPIHARDLIVSTDPSAAPAVPGGVREILDPDLLDRFNTDTDYLTKLNRESLFNFLVLDAFSPTGDDVSGGGSLSNRFTVEPGQTSGFDLDPVPVEDVRCPGEDGSAWSVTVG